MNVALKPLKSYRKLLLPILICLVGIAPADEFKTELQVLSFQKLGEKDSLYWKTEVMQSPDKQPQVRVSSSTLLPPVTYKGPSRLTLLIHSPEKGFQAVASTVLPTGAERTIVVLIPAEKDSKMPFRALAMSGDLKSFKAGTRRLINLSNIPLRGEMGANPFKRGDPKNVRFVCKGQSSTDIPVLDAGAKVLASHPVILEYFGANKKWNILSSTRWFHTPTQRHLLFAFYEPVRKSLVLRGVSDTVAADTRDIPANRANEGVEDPETRAKRLAKDQEKNTDNPREN